MDHYQEVTVALLESLGRLVILKIQQLSILKTYQFISVVNGVSRPHKIANISSYLTQ